MKKSILMWFLSGTLLCGIGLALWLIPYYRYLQAPISLTAPTIVYHYPKGKTVLFLAYDLKRQGIITHPRWFVRAVKSRGALTGLKAGDYLISRDSTPTDLIEMFRAGNVIRTTFNIIPGWSFSQIRSALSQLSTIQHMTASMQTKDLMDRLKITDFNLEGQFFPDSYIYAPGNTDIELLERAHQRMTEKLMTLWAGRADHLPYETPYQALIVASLIEKETHTPRERPVIADIILKRWQTHMRLQIDPTVVFATGSEDPITKGDLSVDSPFNTYRHTGLPPSPIATPSEASLTAALHPMSTPYWYFVAKKDGSHAFSKSLEEHNQNVKTHSKMNQSMKPSVNEEALCPEYSSPSKAPKGLANLLRYMPLPNFCANEISIL